MILLLLLLLLLFLFLFLFFFLVVILLVASMHAPLKWEYIRAGPAFKNFLIILQFNKKEKKWIVFSNTVSYSSFFFVLFLKEIS